LQLLRANAAGKWAVTCASSRNFFSSNSISFLSAPIQLEFSTLRGQTGIIFPSQLLDRSLERAHTLFSHSKRAVRKFTTTNHDESQTLAHFRPVEKL
jgi:hypothetical protein